MKRAILGLNLFFTIFSLVWLIGHSTEQLFDQEFWFALAYLILCLANVWHLIQREKSIS